ncbi:MAG: substrate-binding domain-containing protein [Polyangiaceae bacterium]|nr:substrate-binding domain-containing protein [Polyangiaceae bacterium]
MQSHRDRSRPFARGIARALLGALAALVVLALAGCREEGSAAAGGGKKRRAGTAEDPWLIGVSQCNLGEPWRVQMNEDIKAAAARHPEIKVVYKDAQNESLAQRAQVEELADLGIDLLIISPKEAAPLTRPVAEVYAKGVPVIVLDRAVEGDRFTMFIGADNRRIGREAGRWIAKALGGKGKIVELKGLMTSTPARDRHEGFVEGLDLAANPGLKVVFEADMAWLEPNARKEMESALSAQPEIDLVYAHNDPGAHGAYLAAKQAGRAMRFVGIDALPHEGVEYVKQGILDATFAYPTGGAEAIEAALRILKGEELEKKMVLGTRLFTKENAARGGEEIR